MIYSYTKQFFKTKGINECSCETEYIHSYIPEVTVPSLTSFSSIAMSAKTAWLVVRPSQMSPNAPQHSVENRDLEFAWQSQ